MVLTVVVVTAQVDSLLSKFDDPCTWVCEGAFVCRSTDSALARARRRSSRCHLIAWQFMVVYSVCDDIQPVGLPWKRPDLLRQVCTSTFLIFKK